MNLVTRVGKIALVLPVRIDSLSPVFSIERCQPEPEDCSRELPNGEHGQPTT